MKKSQLRKIIKEEISSVLNESGYFQLLDKIEKLDAKILNSKNVETKKEWEERRGEIMGQYGDDNGWDGMGIGDLETAIEDAQETIEYYINEEISKVLNEDNYSSSSKKVANILKAQNYYNDDIDLVAKLEQKFNTQINDKNWMGNPTALPFIDSLIKRWRPQWYENEELGMNAFDLENFVAKTIRSYR